MRFENEMRLTFLSRSENEAFARVTAAAFFARLDPPVSDISDIKTAVSEAVTNAIIHGYESNRDGMVTIFCGYIGSRIYIDVTDEGRGIEDIAKARQPLFTTKPEEDRSGMGFTVMETFMDSVSIWSEPGKGTKVSMMKQLSIPMVGGES
ncbi:MAG: anti-sigma F factor [Clostridiales bacterium]|nr:anti-sigma F factor [Clostridiales bacterium]